MGKRGDRTGVAAALVGALGFILGDGKHLRDLARIGAEVTM